MDGKHIRLEYTNKNFRKNLEYLVSRENTTKSSIEKEFEMGEGSLSRYCKLDEGAPEPKIGILNSLAKAFNVTIDDLINSDLESKERESLEITRNKDIMFCNKLIENTKLGVCDWHKLNHYNDGFIESQYSECSPLYSNWLNTDGMLSSKFICRVYDIDKLYALTTIIDDDTQVVIIKYSEPLEEETKSIYEMYLVKSCGKVLSSCSSHRQEEIFEDVIFKEVFYNVLKQLYEVAYDYIVFGKDTFEKELIYNKYLGLVL